MASYTDYVRDDSGYQRPVEGAQALLLNTDGSLAEAVTNPVTTDSNGAFTFLNVTDGVYTLDIRYAGASKSKGSVTIGTPPQFVGPAGSSNNTRINLAALKAAAITDKTSLYDGSLWTWTPGNFSATPAAALDALIVKADSTSLSVGAWLRSVETVSVKTFGAKGDGVSDDKAPFQGANDYLAALGGGTILSPIGDYRLSAVVTLHPRVSLQGSGNQQTIIRCAGSGFRTVDAAGDHGQTVYQGFRMIGAGRTVGTALAIAMADQVDSGLPRRVRGVRFRDVQIESFNAALDAQSMWDADIAIAAHNVTYGIRLRGQCVNCVVNGSSLTAENADYSDGSVGVLCDEHIYADGISRRPEEPKITGGSRIFGFDTNVWINRALKATVSTASLDGALRIGLRISTADYSYVVDDVYFATIHDTRGTTMLEIDALGSPNSAFGTVASCSFAAAGVYSANSTAIRYEGSNRTGKLTLRGCTTDVGAGVGKALSLQTAENVTADDCRFAGQVASYERVNLGGHVFNRCTFNGPILRPPGIANVPDRFTDCDGTAVTGIRGPRLITIPANATTATVTLSSLGLAANPVTGSPANLTVIAKATQISGTTDRGATRAYYDGSGNVVVKVATSLTSDSNDVQLELSAQ